MFMTKRGRRTLREEKEMGEKRFEKDGGGGGKKEKIFMY